MVLPLETSSWDFSLEFSSDLFFGTFLGTYHWNNSLEQFFGTILWNYSLELFFGTTLWNYSLEPFFGPILWDYFMVLPFETSSLEFSLEFSSDLFFGLISSENYSAIFWASHLKILFLQDCVFYWISSFTLPLDLTFGSDFWNVLLALGYSY
jgi:hypothetical protein